ncbi:MFS transporter [Halomonas huangheensis]|uniref:Major facilitator superfamily (MFS) profile domain-containing protein n=1 Tax=Halomonas huangheensis TaxID=1178482 RepID=W1N1F0_9GAMM|nr:MFS transporter [Halomonas huangheensis]ERL49309.1 hypothetical protein BJB45_07500 [Halomonas huangheensis]
MTTISLSLLGRQALFGWMNFALALPSIYLLLGMPLIMREYGWSGTDIGLFQLAGLPAVFKLCLAVPVERWRLIRGHYQGWSMLLCVLLAALLWGIGQQSLLSQREWLFGLALLVGVLATWADVPVNALAIKLLPESERMRAGAIRSASLFLAAIVGGGLMLVAHSRWGWQAPFALMSAVVLLGMPGLMCSADAPREATSYPRPGRAGVDWRGYFAQPGAGSWTCLLVLGFPFIGAAWLYLKPLLLDQGIPVEQVAWGVGVGGGVLGAAASIAGAGVARRMGLVRTIPLFTAMSLFALVCLTGAVWSDAGRAGLILCVALVAIAMGATSSLLFGLMMFFARPRQQASDYGLQASLFVISRLAVPVVAGILLDVQGYIGMLLGLTLAMSGVFMLAVRCRHVLASAVRRHSGSGICKGVREPASPSEPLLTESKSSFVATQDSGGSHDK